MCKSKLFGGMGFLNLQAFNLALLAKQGWQILTNPTSLVAQVYKAKYFPYEDVLNSRVRSNPSYAWRSIHNSLRVLREGTRWRVGNGKRIHIWEDRWLPTPSTYKVVSPYSNFDNFPMVSSLIDEDTKWWKSDLVRPIFFPFEADSILKIPICYSLPNDQLIWMGNKRGSFSVKSAYYIAMHVVKENEFGESTSEHNQSSFWKKIWQLNVPPKIWESAKRAFLDYKESRLSSLTSLFSACNQWTSPPPSFFKINVDDTTDAGGGNSCIGVAIRDFSGSSTGALSLVLPSCFPVETTEAYALLHGVLFALEIRVDQAIFESNALSIILALNSGAAGSDIGHILEDIREASSTFSLCSFHHLKRDGNRAAHSLAKEAKSSSQ
ncbi:uncharacterized protein LOC111986467 [Quercus suber]|uniref:uncharacterized protein LOC111986467 n=1 Tax=Quercus suber TaxID=58331 RepID=UPI000CE1747F|nr:uncharacterized protein LOC111986467 [Quercus suber]